MVRSADERLQYEASTTIDFHAWQARRHGLGAAAAAVHPALAAAHRPCPIRARRGALCKAALRKAARAARRARLLPRLRGGPRLRARPQRDARRRLGIHLPGARAPDPKTQAFCELWGARGSTMNPGGDQDGCGASSLRLLCTSASVTAASASYWCVDQAMCSRHTMNSALPIVSDKNCIAMHDHAK
ncbi:hypothetical protein T492DRAFT_963279 [Pavlovales sp. CCMP2436]|nr:hypothetical protein T492DRAFT_963279 [Pavlovales sp. CCMP2436]